MNEEYPVTYDLTRRSQINKWGHICFTTIHCSICNRPKSAIGAKFIQGEQFGRMVCKECQKTK